MSDTPHTTPKSAIFLAYLFVGIPLAWGVYQTILKAMALFR